MTTTMEIQVDREKGYKVELYEYVLALTNKTLESASNGYPLKFFIIFYRHWGQDGQEEWVQGRLLQAGGGPHEICQILDFSNKTSYRAVKFWGFHLLTKDLHLGGPGVQGEGIPLLPVHLNFISHEQPLPQKSQWFTIIQHRSASCCRKASCLTTFMRSSNYS